MGHFDASVLLDHMVVNVRFEMDDAAAAFGAVGFSLTERGYHTLGSMNHLMILDSDYLELIGVTPENASRRPEVANGEVGLNGLVFKSDDVDATYRHLCALGMDGDPPRAFSRPLEVSGRSEEASFRTVAVRNGVFSAGRVYFCEHLTPHLVWRDEWRSHANGARATDRFQIVADDVGDVGGRFAALLERTLELRDDDRAAIDVGGGATLEVVSPQAYRDRFGELALSVGDGDCTFGAIGLKCRSLSDAETVLGAARDHCTLRRHANALQVRVDRYRCLLELTA